MSGHTSARAEPVCARLVREPHEILLARRLHAAVYLAKRYVEPHDVVDGVIGASVDPWTDSSAYFLARDVAGTPVGDAIHALVDREAGVPMAAMPERLEATDPVGRLHAR